MFRGVRHLRRIAPAAALAVWLGGCASLGIADPDNQPITGNAEQAFASSRTDPNAGDDVLIGLTFSGGGTRAAAFSYGVLTMRRSARGCRCAKPGAMASARCLTASTSFPACLAARFWRRTTG